MRVVCTGRARHRSWAQPLVPAACFSRTSGIGSSVSLCGRSAPSWAPSARSSRCRFPSGSARPPPGGSKRPEASHPQALWLLRPTHPALRSNAPGRSSATCTGHFEGWLGGSLGADPPAGDDRPARPIPGPCGRLSPRQIILPPRPGAHPIHTSAPSTWAPARRISLTGGTSHSRAWGLTA